MVRKLLVLMLAVPLCGCASQIQALDGYYSAVGTTAQAASELRMKRLKYELCSTPFSTIVRHPETYSAVISLCVGGKVSAEDLLTEHKAAQP